MRELPAARGLFETHLTVSDLDRAVAFYRDIVGLPPALELPERGAAFFWVGGQGEAMLGLWSLGSAPMALSLHIGLSASLEDVRSSCDALRAAGIVPWSEWARAEPVRVECHAGPRDTLRALFEEAEDSAQQLEGYLDDGEVLVARAGDSVVGHLQLTEAGDGGAGLEIKSMAVDAAHRGRGIGRRLIRAAVDRAREQRRGTLVVATGAADVGNLRFYQRAGFRLRSVERDAFSPATGYATGTLIDGVALRDRVWLDLQLNATC